MSETGDEPQRVDRVRPPWLAPLVIGLGLLVLTGLCVGLSIWGP